jgi:hypothetical protein
LGVEALKNHFNPTGKFLPFCRCRVEHKRGRIREVSFAVKYWEIIIENLRNAGWNCGCMATTDGKGRPIWVVAAERSDAGRFIVRADQELPAFLARIRNSN